MNWFQGFLLHFSHHKFLLISLANVVVYTLFDDCLVHEVPLKLMNCSSCCSLVDIHSSSCLYINSGPIVFYHKNLVDNISAYCSVQLMLEISLTV